MQNKKYNILFDGKKSFTFTDAGIGEFIYIILEKLLIMVLSLIIGLGIPKHTSLSYIFSFLVELGFLATVFIVARANRTAVFYAVKLNNKITLKQVGVICIICVLALFGFSPITNSFVSFLTNIGYSSDLGISVNTWGQYILFIFLMAIVPAVCEEFLFRGLIYQGLKKWNQIGAIFLSALFFMLMHGTPDQTIHQFLLGIILALVFSATGSIWAPILLHFLNNFVALTINFISNMSSTSETLQNEISEASKTPWGELAMYFIYSVIIAAVAGIAIWYLIRYINENKSKYVNNDIQNGEESLQSFEEDFSSDSSRKLSITLFILSGVWLVIEWIMALINGIN